jgi:hypothetical protein
MWRWIGAGVITGLALLFLLVVLPVRRAFRYFEEED